MFIFTITFFSNVFVFRITDKEKQTIHSREIKINVSSILLELASEKKTRKKFIIFIQQVQVDIKTTFMRLNNLSAFCDIL